MQRYPQIEFPSDDGRTHIMKPLSYGQVRVSIKVTTAKRPDQSAALHRALFHLVKIKCDMAKRERER